MDIDYTPSGIEEIISKQFVRFIDTTPSSNSPRWAVVGVGVEDGNANIEYNPNVDRVKWIIDKNARTRHSSNDKQMSVTQNCHKGDPEFEFVEKALGETYSTSEGISTLPSHSSPSIRAPFTMTIGFFLRCASSHGVSLKALELISTR